MGTVKAERLIAIDGEIVAELQAVIEVRDKWAESPVMRNRGSRAKNQIGHHKGDSGKITNLEIRRGSGKERKQQREARIDQLSLRLGSKMDSATCKQVKKAAWRQGNLDNLNKALKRSEIDGRKAMQFKSIEEFDAFIK